MLLGKPESILSPNIREQSKGENFVHSNQFGLYNYGVKKKWSLIIFAIFKLPITLFIIVKKNKVCVLILFTGGGGG